MNVLVEKIIKKDKDWLDNKISEFLTSAKTRTKDNFSGLLG